jgi:hypothetical protein
MNRLLLMGMMFVLALVSFQSWGAARVPCSQEDEEWCQAIYELDEAWCLQNLEITACLRLDVRRTHRHPCLTRVMTKTVLTGKKNSGTGYPLSQFPAATTDKWIAPVIDCL